MYIEHQTVDNYTLDILKQDIFEYTKDFGPYNIQEYLVKGLKPYEELQLEELIGIWLTIRGISFYDLVQHIDLIQELIAGQ